ncbi:hypothetical protein P7D95_09450 [Enterococcus avium]|uniref:hypothetical protein n=1 Tax=Enterococcus avium TaxID=33945 RepID=UPI00288D9C80|nr:hypothetical protein [Enterococcus avium]MDT2501028.1 hypothetical protein [Enterococcus avium]
MDLTQNEAIEKSLSKVITEENANELANLEGKALEETFECLYEQMEYQNLMPKEPTVKSLVQSLYELSIARLDADLDQEVVQDLFGMEIMQLADLLGIELEG